MSDYRKTTNIFKPWAGAILLPRNEVPPPNFMEKIYGDYLSKIATDDYSKYAVFNKLREEGLRSDPFCVGIKDYKEDEVSDKAIEKLIYDMRLDRNPATISIQDYCKEIDESMRKFCSSPEDYLEFMSGFREDCFRVTGIELEA